MQPADCCLRQTAAMPSAYRSAAGVEVKWEHRQDYCLPGKLRSHSLPGTSLPAIAFLPCLLWGRAGGLLHVARVFAGNHVPELLWEGVSRTEQARAARSSERHGLRHRIVHALRCAGKAGTDTGRCSSKAIDDKG